jgi:hypothetical protein
VNPKSLEISVQREYAFFSKGTSMPATVKEKAKNAVPSPKVRKSKFQADLAPSEDSIVRALKAELQMTSNTDFLSDALALFRWAVSERKRGHVIVSESATGERKILVFPRLERVAPEVALPHIDIHWNDKELETLAKLASGEPAQPTKGLVRAMRH